MSERTKCLLAGFCGTCIAISFFLALNAVGDLLHDYVTTKYCVREATTIDAARLCTLQGRKP